MIINVINFSPVVEMQKVVCNACGDGAIWVASGDAGPYFCTLACQEVYMNTQNNKAPERESNGESNCTVQQSLLDSSSLLLLEAGSVSLKPDSST